MAVASPRKIHPEPNRVLWTRPMLHCLIANNIIEGARYELFEGELVEKMKHRPHIITQRRLLQALLLYFAQEYLQTEAPIDISPEDNETNAPEPDLAILARPDTEFVDRAPGAADILLAIEVADSTLRRDLGAKAKRYAKAGISEYWVVDIENRQVHVHREPIALNEAWRSIEIFSETQTITPLTNLSAMIIIEEILPPKEEK
jgi:Uma2 family endonuclease